MVETPAPSFDRPIPGMSLTAELGNRPWQQPPQYSTVEEALQWYIPRLINPTLLEQLLDVMESGIPLTTIANSMQTGGVMEGKHSLDVGILIMPVLVETMAYLAEEAEIEYTVGADVKTDPDIVSDSTMAVVKQKVKARMDKSEEEKPVIEEPEPQEEKPSGGLMSRGTTDGGI
tara:strand:- start:199 stop:720 length:522 start_codon:yes stop_codon:yes gene_type:complete